MSPDPRSSVPLVPDERLLAEAAVKWASLLAEPSYADISWEVGSRMDRARSSVYPLRAIAGDREIGSAFYKVMLPSTKGDSERHQLRVDRARSGLARTMELDERLASTLGGEEITFSRALAVDPETLTTVTVGVQGVPFGGVGRHLGTRTRRRRAIHWMELTGRSARLIEECTIGAVDDREDERSELMDRRLDRVAPWLEPGEGDRLRIQVDDLYGRAMISDHPVAYAHGDFSLTNLLVGDGLGLIDFEWVPRLRVFDLANLVFRLQYETALPTRLVKPLVEAAIRGYGDPDVVTSPAWRFHRISNLLKVVRYGPRPWYQRQAGRTRRAFAELASLAGPLSSR